MVDKTKLKQFMAGHNKLVPLLNKRLQFAHGQIIQLMILGLKLS
jgi:hypothetical protein